jgi:hypothetical protein
LWEEGGELIHCAYLNGVRLSQQTILRKAQSNVGLLGSAWAWTVPVAVLTYLVLQGRDANAIKGHSPSKL